MMNEEFGSNPKFKSSKSPKVAVVYGGTSPESAISVKSGTAVEKALRNLQFDVVALDPAREEEFQRGLDGVDAVFLVLHGAGGEDGTIQRYLDSRGLPYVGSSPRGCELSFDKKLTKEALVKKGLPTPEYEVFDRSDAEEKLKRFPGPFFVKPLRDGSSLGVFCVENYDAGRDAVAEALERYGTLLAEKKIAGREFTVGILGNRALPVIELCPKNDFYDYQAKYTKGLCEYLVPAPIDADAARRFQDLALAVHRCLRLRDFSRIDLMADENLNPYVLEANAIPGFTEMSLLPKAAACAGITFEKLCDRLLQSALKRAARPTPAGVPGETL